MRIAIITGGETAEREVSIRSAENIRKAIDFAETKLFTFPEEKSLFIESVNHFDIAIPVIHGAGGEDGTLQALFKILGIPFIFSDTGTHARAIDKKRTKELVDQLGVMSPKEIETFPLFAKPNRGGSSVASKFCSSQEELDELYANNPGTEFLTEESISGREFTVGILEHRGKTFALPVIEIIPKGKFFDYESKYDPNNLAAEICPAKINEELSNTLQKKALDIHNHLDARHLSRSDFIVTPENQIYFLEINTIPGMTATSLIPKMLKEIKVSLTDILKEWCEANYIK